MASYGTGYGSIFGLGNTCSTVGSVSYVPTSVTATHVIGGTGVTHSSWGDYHHEMAMAQQAEQVHQWQQQQAPQPNPMQQTISELHRVIDLMHARITELETWVAAHNQHSTSKQAATHPNGEKPNLLSNLYEPHRF